MPCRSARRHCWRRESGPVPRKTSRGRISFAQSSPGSEFRSSTPQRDSAQRDKDEQLFGGGSSLAAASRLTLAKLERWPRCQKKGPNLAARPHERKGSKRYAYGRGETCTGR